MSPTLSKKTLLHLRDFVRFYGAGEGTKPQLLAALDRALAPSKSSKYRTTRRKEAKAAKKTKAEETAEIRNAVFHRARGECEAMAFGLSRCGATPTELDHFISRRHGQSVESCWALCHLHHEQKTNNFPDAETWLNRFLAHCGKHNYRREFARAEKRFLFVTTRKALSSGGAR